MRNRLYVGLILLLVLLLSACGAESKEDVLKKLSTKWVETKGYELDAKMKISTGSEPRLYEVSVWHTKPEFYRVKVSQTGEDVSQTIVRNKEGVFVITPTLGKTYKFQSDWPEKNSQAYLIGSLAQDIKADKESVMTETENSYVFETKTRNSHQKMLPTQKIHISKKSLLPTKVFILNDQKEEQISITFDKITLGTSRSAADYKADMPEDTTKNETASTDTELPVFQTHYPSLQWEGINMVEEKVIKDDKQERVILTYGGNKEFTIIQSPIVKKDVDLVPVFAAGDPADLGFVIGAITDQSITWEQDGVQFFLASDSMSREEMMTVASSMTASESK
ncbi:LolA family protein [Paenisporosarcina sp. TG-14]|uniref:LolA family protein n=1 Tax=Paenisporosarcina sp. TG-14 TaxID=1231057 RepID=UPI00035F47CB|nr:outer membrane lipoprotein carrier protein LolA [Paenisporosarcina sp. TG-14]